MTDALLDFYLKSNAATLGVLALLALYFITLNWVFLYRYFSINSWISKESSSLEALLMGASTVAQNSYLNHFIRTSEKLSKEVFDLGMYAASNKRGHQRTLFPLRRSFNKSVYRTFWYSCFYFGHL